VGVKNSKIEKLATLENIFFVGRGNSIHVLVLLTYKVKSLPFLSNESVDKSSIDIMNYLSEMALNSGFS